MRAGFQTCAGRNGLGNAEAGSLAGFVTPNYSSRVRALAAVGANATLWRHRRDGQRPALVWNMLSNRPRQAVHRLVSMRRRALGQPQATYSDRFNSGAGHAAPPPVGPRRFHSGSASSNRPEKLPGVSSGRHSVPLHALGRAPLADSAGDPACRGSGRLSRSPDQRSDWPGQASPRRLTCAPRRAGDDPPMDTLRGTTGPVGPVEGPPSGAPNALLIRSTASFL